MARRARPTGLNAKVYRHFAVITVCLTGTLAIFADGENRAAVVACASAAGVDHSAFLWEMVD